MLEYPTSHLEECMSRCKKVHDQMGRKQMGRDALAAALGYSSVNGTSIAKMSDLRKFGLVEGSRDSIRLTDLFMQLQFPQQGENVQEAKLLAATKPDLFGEIHRKFPQYPVNEANIASYLAREGMEERRVQAVTRDYLKTMEFVNSGNVVPAAPVTTDKEPEHAPHAPSDVSQSDWTFKGKGVSLTVADNADEPSLNMAKHIIESALAQLTDAVPQLTYKSDGRSEDA